MTHKQRIKDVTEAEFKTLLAHDRIRPASLDDINGTHHKRPLYIHPRTQQYYVETKWPKS